MTRRPRRSIRGVSESKILKRTSAELTDDTEKLMSSSMEKIEGDPVHSHSPHSHPKLPPAVPHHDYSAHEITNVPAPIPDAGLPSPSTDTTTTIVTSHVSASQTSATLYPSLSPEPSKSTFVPLPSLETLNLTEIEGAAAHSSLLIHSMSTTSPITTTTASSDSHDSSPQLNASHLSTAATIALAVSGGLTLLVAIVLAKLLKRPCRRRTPTPSLPILHDGTFPDKVDSEGSPIFGGKECSSPALQARDAKENTGLWTWTQYNSGIPKPARTVTVTRTNSQDQLLSINQTAQRRGLGVADDDTTHVQGESHNQYPFLGYGNLNAISKTKSPVPLQPVQNAITRAVSRLSTVSMSLYPNSPGEYSQVGGDVGVAIDGVAHDESGAAPRYKNRVMTSCNRTSIIAASAKDAAALRRSQSFAYGGMEPTSSPTSPDRGRPNGGRARIKSTNYTPGSYPRASAATINHRKQDRDHEQDGTRVEENKIGGGDPRRARDLTSGLRVTPPIPASPQPTLYPEDSMSVIGEAKKVTLAGRAQKKPVPDAVAHCDSPPSDAAALGNLMMVDFAESKSRASLVSTRACEAARAREGQGDASSLLKRVEDGPPRVPSPPPIPSLAQMAMQHGDPEGYADYHSPTYSIYGLYDGDRKSRGLSYGHA